MAKPAVKAAPTARATAYGPAKECLQASKGDHLRAQAALEKRAGDDPELTEALITLGCERAMQDAVHEVRSRLLKTGHNEAREDNVTGLYQVASANLLAFPLPGGGALGDASADRINEAGKFFLRQARGNYQSAAWLGLIVKAMGNAKRVRDALDHQALLKLRIKAENDGDRF